MEKITPVKPMKFLLFVVFSAALASLAGCATMGAGHGTGRQPLSVASIIKMSQNGVPADRIIHRIHDSQTVYRLKPSQVALLEQIGVPRRVVHYMQKTYNYAIRQNVALKEWQFWNADNDGYWYGGPFRGIPWPSVNMPPEGQ